MSARQLTARGVKTRLTRAGVNHSALSITNVAQRARAVDFHTTGPWERRNIVVITAATREERRAAHRVLFDAGLICAGYPDRDEWRA